VRRGGGEDGGAGVGMMVGGGGGHCCCFWGGGLEGLRVMAAEVGGWGGGICSERRMASCDGRHSVFMFSGLERSDLVPRYSK